MFKFQQVIFRDRTVNKIRLMRNLHILPVVDEQGCVPFFGLGTGLFICFIPGIYSDSIVGHRHTTTSYNVRQVAPGRN